MVAILLGFFGLVAARAAAPPSPPGADLSVRVWTIEDGMPQDTVTGITQDKLGFLWLSTLGGVARFDGARFEVFDLAAGHGLTSNRFVSVFADRDGVLWLGAEEGGLLRAAPAVAPEFSDAGVAGPLAKETVRSIEQAPDGALWFGTASGAYRLLGGVVDHFGEAEGIVGGAVSALRVDASGRLWAGGAGGLFRFEGGRFALVASGVAVSSIAVSPDGELWVGAANQVLRYTGDQVETVYTDSLGVNLIAWDRRGRMWVSSPAGPGVWTPEGVMPTGVESLRGPAAVRVAFTDREGNVWFGTNGRGLHEVREHRFIAYDLPLDAREQELGSVVQSADGTVWLGGSCAGLFRVTGGALGAVDESLCVRTLAADPEAGVWMGTRTGLEHLGPDGRRDRAVEGALPPGAVDALLVDPGGRLWVGTHEHGVYLEGSEGFAPVDGLGGVQARVIAAGPDGEVWCGGTGAVTIYRAGSVRSLGAADGLPPGQVRDILVDPTGVAWLASYGGGLSRVEGATVTRYTTREGLPDNAVSRVLDDGAGSLWMNSNLGAFRVPREDLEAAAAGRRGVLRVDRFSTGEGGNGSPAGLHARDGSFWFPTVNGATRVNPEAQREGLVAPAVVIESVGLDGQPLADGAVVDAESRDLLVRFTVPYFQDPADLRFRYRLAGYDDGWVEADAGRLATYTNLPPGSFRFEVQAASRSGEWAATPATLSFQIRPRFSETGWFRLGLGALGFGAAAGLFQVRLGLERRRTDALRREIAAREAVEGALREREQHYRAIFGQAANGFFLHRADGSLVEVNQAACGMLRLTRGEVEQLPPLAFVATESRGAYLALVRAVLEGAKVEDDSIRLLRGGASFEVRVTGTAPVHGQGMALFSVVDLEEERRLERQRRLVEERARVAQKFEAVGALAGGVAHEFNNLLTVMVAQAGLLEQTLQGEARQMAAEIRQYGERGAGLTNKLLALSHSQVLRPSAIDFRRFFAEHARVFRDALRPEITFSTQVEDGLPRIELDAAQLQRSLVSLLENAAAAIVDAGSVVIEVGTEMVAGAADLAPVPHVVIAVRDTGSGMDEEVRAHLFEPYFSTRLDGGGLGLPTVRGFVEQSGGSIHVETSLGEGSSFLLYFPVSETPRPELPKPPVLGRPEELSPGPLTVLVVDDEPAIVRAAARLLRRAGYRVIETDAPADALEILRTQDVDLLLTDVEMPDMKGTELAAVARVDRPGIRVVFMSGYNREGSLSREIYLEKPFSAAVLVELVAQALQP